MGVIRLVDIEKVYSGDLIETPVLNQVQLSLKRNEFTAVVGASGSGKSTLLSLVSTLDQPTSGQVFFDDVNVAGLKGNRLADFRFERIGMVFQHFHLLPTLTALENVMSPFFGRRTKVDYKKKAAQLLAQLGLAAKQNSLPSQLSGGEQQRVAIARALVNEPEWLLADEPTGNLDSRNAQLFYDLLHQLKREFGCGIVVVTHDMQLAQKADRLIEIRDGRVVEDRSLHADGGSSC
ncbi:ABC transporter ATP-binding protein [Paenibacillus sp. CF384]|uniref:ABC transporter ATP-binding protein n=1 Tax=Paenibacillus sp. CF384 TaxID=1884382 RepID=UPI00089584D0|nr:ABC transporter ATP-binding protein [Paenibacillus sp. CF384]SDX80205.1 putative ABC transport system ATP-binding protein/lipoprotein-releasing system ATP-binding protein [Paenibacillus sp. CF384]